MRAEVRFALRRLVWLCLNHVKPVRSPQAKLVKLVCQTGFLECQHPFIDEPMLRTKPPVASARLLGLGRNYILARCRVCSTKILLDSS